MGIRFKEQHTIPSDALPRDSAINAAVNACPGLDGRENIGARYGSMTNDGMYTLIPSTGERIYAARDRLVWLMRVSDVEVPSFAPGSKLPPQVGLNVVIDAVTGEYLFAYSGSAGD
ncbi:MAG TPA: hypothetical protein DEV93_18095 [Chloroflexi bacterium]|jgi:hypothetical protein|nr:hypothetical protein [Chloroflexota bacterium]